MPPTSDIIEYVSIPPSFVGSWDAPRYFDEPFPLNLSRYLWLMSGQSQRRYEQNLLATWMQ